MAYIDTLRSELEKKKEQLSLLQEDMEHVKKNRKEISFINKEIKRLETSIMHLEEESIRRDTVEMMESHIPEEIKQFAEYQFARGGYISKNTAPLIGEMQNVEDGKVIFTYGGVPETYEGKLVFQMIDGQCYRYEERKVYDFDTGEELTNILITVEGNGEKYTTTAMKRNDVWTYHMNNTYQWKEVEDSTQIPFQEMITRHNGSEVFKQFFDENYMPTQKKETIKKQVLISEKQQTREEPKTVNDLKKMYSIVLDEEFAIITVRKPRKDWQMDYAFYDPMIQKAGGEVTTKLYFQDEEGRVSFIPELSDKVEEKDGKYYLSHAARYYPTRKGTTVFDVHEWSLEKQNNNKEDKYTRYVTLDALGKVVKVFESSIPIDFPMTDLYHRKKDENGQLSIQLVDLKGNVHKIKETGKAGENNLTEKTFGPQNDYQLRVIYKEKEPVYAFVIGDNFNHIDFCTAQELQAYYQKSITEFQRYGIPVDDKSCFVKMGEVIENFNESFMQGKFIPLTNQKEKQEQEKSLQELAQELKTLEIQEQGLQELEREYRKLEEQVREI